MADWMIYELNLTTGKATHGPVPEAERWLGGRGLTSHVVANQVPPKCRPLGPENVLVLATGLLAGSGASSATRLSLGAKSPLTQGIKESNIGGTAGHAMAQLGVRGLILRGGCQEGWQIAHLSRDGLSLLPADDVSGREIYPAIAALRERFGPRAAVLAIGPAGEQGLAAACAGGTDLDGLPGRQAGRGGLGAVMGAKHLKAIVIDPGTARAPGPVDRDRALAASRRLARALLDHPSSGKSLPTYGTAVLVNLVNTQQGLPTHNYREGSFASAERISGEALRSLIEERGGRHGHPCMPGCTVRCSNVLPAADGQELTRGFEYESIVMLGANCGIDDLDGIALLNRRCDELGLDTIEIGAALAVAMEAGVAPFGDLRAALAMVEEIGRGTALGRVLGNGAAVTGRVFGNPRVPVVRGQALAAYDPRALKGTGVTYATSPMGADHTAGNALPGSMLPDGTRPDPHSPNGQGELSRYLQEMAGVFDLLGLCWFARYPILSDTALLTDLLEAYLGGEWSMERLRIMARAMLSTELRYNQAAGMEGPAGLPDYFRTEALPPGGYIFDVPEEALAAALAGL